MPSFDEIQMRLSGAWRLMNGKADGLQRLDLSADGFWNSFFAILLALPALAAGWANSTSALADPAAPFAERLSILGRLAFIDLAAWLVPIAVLALVAGRAGIAGRFVPYVVASNWASVLLVWMMLPPVLLEFFLPGAQDAAGLVALGIFLVSLGLGWRLTNASLGKGAAVATAVFVAVFTVSLFVVLTLQGALGLYAASGG